MIRGSAGSGSSKIGTSAAGVKVQQEQESCSFTVNQTNQFIKTGCLKIKSSSRKKQIF